MARKTPTSNPKRRTRKFANCKGVASNDLQALQAIRKVEVSKYNSVKNTDSAYTGHRSRGRSFLKDLVAKREEDEAEGTIDDGICTAVLAKAFDNGPPNKYSALALEMFIVQKCYGEGCGESTADGISSAFAALWDFMYVRKLFIDLKIYWLGTETERFTQANIVTMKKLVKLKETQHVQSMSRQLYIQ